MVKAKGKKKAKKRRVVPEANVYILATFNNTFITITSPEGEVLVTYTPAKIGFKNTKKRTPYAATQAAIAAAQEAMEKYGVRAAKVFVKGPGIGRNPAIKGLASAGLQVKMLVDTTNPPFNGPRPPKRPRK